MMQAKEKKFYSMLGLTIFCTLLFSFIAFPGILYASKANTQYALGNVDEARKLNKRASIWCWVSVVAVLILAFFQFPGGLNFDMQDGASPAKALKERFAQGTRKTI